MIDKGSALTSRRIVGAWFAMAGAMIANGTVRETIINRFTTAYGAAVISAISGVTLIQQISWRTLRTRNVSVQQRATVTTAWLAMTLVFEFTFGHYVDRKSWKELVADYNLFAGRLWPLVLISIAAAPFIWGRGDASDQERRG